MKKSFLLTPFLAILSACQPPMTREQELAIYRSRCLDYGFPMGTIEFAQCMQEQEAREAKLYMQERKIQAIQQQNQRQQQNVQIQQNEFVFKQKKQRQDKKNRKN